MTNVVGMKPTTNRLAAGMAFMRSAVAFQVDTKTAKDTVESPIERLLIDAVSPRDVGDRNAIAEPQFEQAPLGGTQPHDGRLQHRQRDASSL